MAPEKPRPGLEDAQSLQFARRMPTKDKLYTLTSCRIDYRCWYREVQIIRNDSEAD